MGFWRRCFPFASKTWQLFSSLTFSVKMCPEVERSFNNMYSAKRGQPGDVTLEESAENLRGKEMLLSGAQGLFERKRVALRAALPLNNSSNS